MTVVVGAVVLVAPLALVAAVLLAVRGGGDGPAPAGGVAVAGPSAAAPYAVFASDPDGTVVRFDPCTPIRWTFNPAGAPPGGRELVAEAFERVAAASGLVFVDVGDTDETVASDRPALAASGTDWAPVLVAWVDHAAVDVPLRLQDRAVALTVAVEGPDGRTLVTGQLALNAAWPLDVDFGDRHVAWGATVLHEIGHLVGLDHVDAPGELMHASPGFGPAELGPGDRAGLQAVGRAAGCRAVPQPRPVDVAPPRTVSD